MKYMFYLCMLFIVIACTSGSPESADSVWLDRTQTITRLSANNNGWFSEYNPYLEADPYATYYALLTLKLLGETPPHAEATREWILQALEQTLNTAHTHPTTLADLYYLVNSLVILDTPVPHQDRIRATVESFYDPDGYFIGSEAERSLEPNTSVIVPTHQALSLLSLLDVQPKHTAQIIEWLDQVWQQESAKATVDIGLLGVVYETLAHVAAELICRSLN